ncbi:MAG: hypothetical protein AB1942_01750 [Pseudomonadota bacterium]
MLSRIDRFRRVTPVRRAARPEAGRVDETPGAEVVTLPVPVAPAGPYQRVQRRDFRHGDCEFEAQLIGQEGERRGLRAGPALLDIARSAYNRVEWSGSYDRRAQTGRKAVAVA